MDQVLRKRTVHRWRGPEAYVRTEVVPARPAYATHSAGQARFHRDAVTRLKVGNALPYRFDRARCLMPQYERGFQDEIADSPKFEVMNVAATNADRAYLHADIAGSWRTGVPDVPDHEIKRFAENDSLHVAYLRSNMCRL